MAKRSATKLWDRDIDILTALDRCPLTSAQLLLLSETFCRSFTDEHVLRRRLRQLAAAGLIQRWSYSSTSWGRSPSYSKLTRDGYRTLYGIDCPLPKRRYFEAISPAHHHHTQSLADFIVHTVRLAHRHGWSIANFARENSVRIDVHGMTLYPDACFQIVTPGRAVNFAVELDNGTERVRSQQDVESIERKIRGYDLHTSQFAANDPALYFVLFVTTRSRVRVEHVVQLAMDTMRNPDRSLIYATDLPTYLASSNLLNERVFLDNQGRRRSLIRNVSSGSKAPSTLVTSHALLC